LIVLIDPEIITKIKSDYISIRML